MDDNLALSRGYGAYRTLPWHSMKKAMVNQIALGPIQIPLLLRNAGMTAVHQLARSPPGSFKVPDAFKLLIFWKPMTAILKGLRKYQNILIATRFGLRYPSMSAGMASNPWHWQGSSLKVQTKLSRNRWQEGWNLGSGSRNHFSLNMGSGLFFLLT